MKDFEHEHVLSLYGVVILQNKPHVLLPFMAHGDLRGFVSNSRNVGIAVERNMYSVGNF